MGKKRYGTLPADVIRLEEFCNAEKTTDQATSKRNLSTPLPKTHLRT